MTICMNLFFNYRDVDSSFYYFFRKWFDLYISVDNSVTKKSFNFAKKHRLPFYFVSASDGSNVVKVITHILSACGSFTRIVGIKTGRTIETEAVT